MGGSSGSLASARVAAAAAAAGAAAAGVTGARHRAQFGDTTAAPAGRVGVAQDETARGARAAAAIDVSEQPGPAVEIASVSVAAAAAAANAVSAAIAATVASRAAARARGRTDADTGAVTPADTSDASAAGAASAAPLPVKASAVAGPPAAAAIPVAPAMAAAALPALPPAPAPVTIQDYHRPPPKESPYIIRASVCELDTVTPPFDASTATAVPATVPVPSPAVEEPNRRYMRPTGDAPDVPGIIRAGHDDQAEAMPKPAPLFSNEGIVREAEARHRGRLLGPIGGLVAALPAAGAALGHRRDSSQPEVETILADSGRQPRFPPHSTWTPWTGTDPSAGGDRSRSLPP